MLANRSILIILIPRIDQGTSDKSLIIIQTELKSFSSAEIPLSTDQDVN
jgi:hypothetical protein